MIVHIVNLLTNFLFCDQDEISSNICCASIDIGNSRNVIGKKGSFDFFFIQFSPGPDR